MKRILITSKVIVLLLVIISLLMTGCVDEREDGVVEPEQTEQPIQYDSSKLNAIKVASEPVLDGEVDTVWADAPELIVTLGETYDTQDPASINDCAGCHAFDSDTTVSLKAVYTNTSLSVLATWPDPTASLTRGGSWSFVEGVWVKQNPLESEDRISFFWPIGEIQGDPYNTGGCMAKCHMYYPTDTDPHVSSHGIVDDAWLESGRGDMWHSKAGRGTGLTSVSGSDLTIDPVTHEVTAGEFSMIGYMDDKYVDEWANDSVNGEDGGRYGDEGKSAYSHNRIADKSRPKYMEMDPTDFADAMVLTQAEIDAGETVGDSTAGVSNDDAATYWSKYEVLNAVIPERILRTPDGSRADLEFGSVWKDGIWTAEITRKLDTASDDDVQFSLSEEYSFGVAIFDNMRHGYQHMTSPMYDMTFVE
ncbi:MAG: hypothetical protein GWP12_00680 [Nitrospirae bacterium]|nr:hypothetical protein [Nitrospirota bacterium]